MAVDRGSSLKLDAGAAGLSRNYFLLLENKHVPLG